VPTRTEPSRRPRRLALALLLAAGLAGCREDWQAATYPASGRLTINGRPAPGALVQLVPKDGAAPDERNSRPWAKVGPDGTFELSTYQGEAGAPPGEYGVAITWPVDAAVLGSPDRLAGKYNAPEKTGLAATLKAEPNQIPPFELAGAKVADAPRPAARTAPPAR
jgi:hypothetical protein